MEEQSIMADQRAFGNTDRSPAEVGTQVRDRAVQFPDDEGVPGAESFQAPGEGRALRRRAWKTLVLEDARAAGLVQRDKLQGGVLVIGTDTCIAVFHGPIMRQTYATRKPLISCAENFVA